MNYYDTPIYHIQHDYNRNEIFSIDVNGHIPGKLWHDLSNFSNQFHKSIVNNTYKSNPLYNNIIIQNPICLDLLDERNRTEHDTYTRFLDTAFTWYSYVSAYRVSIYTFKRAVVKSLKIMSIDIGR